MFSLKGATGQTINLKQALAPRQRLLYGAIKSCILCWFIIHCIFDIVTNPYGYRFIFLPHWDIILMYVYMVVTRFGYIRTEYLEKIGVQNEIKYYNRNFFLTHFISKIDVLAINVEILIIIIYWLTIYETGDFINFQNLEKHRILGVFVLFDKLVVHCMPIRSKQILLVYAFSMT